MKEKSQKVQLPRQQGKLKEIERTAKEMGLGNWKYFYFIRK